MPKIIKNGRTYGGGGGSSLSGDNSIVLTQAQYDALSTAEQNNGTIYFITDGIANYPTAATTRYDHTDSGLTANSVQDAIDENASEIATVKAGLIKIDTEVTTSFTAGTIGTRGAQYSWDNPHENDEYKLISVFPIYIGNSNEYIVQPFYSNGKLYCNFYRAHTGASSCSATIRVIYSKFLEN